MSLQPKILVFENENGSLIQKALEKQYEVAISETYESAISTIDNIEPDIVLVDLDSPLLNDPEYSRLFYKVIKEMLIPVVVTADKEKSSDIAEILESGCFDVIFTPFSEIELLSRVRAALFFRQSLKREYNTDISQRIAQEKYNEEMKRKEDILNSTNDAVFIINYNGTIAEANKKAYQLTGYESGKLVGVDFSDIVNPNRTLFGTMTNFNMGTDNFTGLCIVKSLDEKVYDVDIKISKITYKGTEHLFAVLKDITGFKESQEAYRNLVENSLQGIAIISDGKLLFANKTFSDNTGYSLNELYTMPEDNIFSLIHPDHEAAVENFRERFYHNGEDISPKMTLKIIKKTGEIRWFEIYASIIQYKGKKAVQLTNLDVTDRVLFETELRKHQNNLEEQILERTEELKESEGTLRLLTESTRVGMFIYEDDKIVYVNPAICNITGYEEIELIGKNIIDIIHSDSKDLAIDAAKNLGTSEELPDDMELKIVRKDGKERWVDFQLKLIPSDDKLVVAVSMIDITERVEALKTIDTYSKDLEVKLEGRTKELIKSERQAAFSLMIQGIIHNLRNPLSGIYGNANYLEKMVNKVTMQEDINREDLVVFLNKVSKRLLKFADKLDAMINSMMVKSRSDKTDSIEKIDLKAILESEYEFMNADRKFKHDIRKKLELPEQPLNVSVVPSEMSQIIYNLLTNSIHATWETDAPEITLSAGEDEFFIWFSIKDNGPGIPQENINKIFDPFFTTKPKEGEAQDGVPTGTGLGLYTCSEILKTYQGEIVLDKNYFDGAKFTVYLPKDNGN